MRIVRALCVAAAAASLLGACGQQQPAETTPPPVVYGGETEEIEPMPAPSLPEVDAALLAAPNGAFTPVEPSVVGVFGAPSVMEALAPLLGPEVAEGASVSLSVRESGEDVIADIVRSGLADDAVSAGHVRLEFRREVDGWYPTNAYRRSQCARGALAGQWTTEPCP
jgi:hypothetical protein